MRPQDLEQAVSVIINSFKPRITIFTRLRALLHNLGICGHIEAADQLGARRSLDTMHRPYASVNFELRMIRWMPIHGKDDQCVTHAAVEPAHDRRLRPVHRSLAVPAFYP